MDFFTGYMKFILGFMGLTDVTFISGDGTNEVAQGKITREQYLQNHPVTA